MKELFGRPGSGSGLLLRIGQFAFAAAAIGVMVSADRFATFTAFCYLIASMGLQVLWSFGLACLDFYALRRKRDLQNPILVSLFVVGDWAFTIENFSQNKGMIQKSYNFILLFQVTATLSLAAASASAGIIVLYARDTDFCTSQWNIPCKKYQISVAFAFLTWAFTAISSHVMFWILLASV